jgi:DNA modification methylase
MTNDLQILCGDALDELKKLPAESVQCAVTSPPYFGLRDYKVPGQIGLEKSPAEYVARLVEVFAEVRRVLRNDGTLWLNLGDSYAANRGGTGMPAETLAGGIGGHGNELAHRGRGERNDYNPKRDCLKYGLKHKDLIGIPWRVAFALQADGWYLRSDIIWHKPNCMPESVTDRPTRSHEYIFLLTKSAKYFYDAQAIAEPASLVSLERSLRAVSDNHKNINGAPGQPPHSMNEPRPNRHGSTLQGGDHGRYFLGDNIPEKERRPNQNRPDKQRGHGRRHQGFNERWDAMSREEQCSGMRNKRDVWTVPTASYSDAHFATFPPDLIKPCILAGTRVGDTVLDPFAGSGTTGLVAREFGRHAILIELNQDYVALIRQRTNVTKGLPL